MHYELNKLYQLAIIMIHKTLNKNNFLMRKVSHMQR